MVLIRSFYERMNVDCLALNLLLMKLGGAFWTPCCPQKVYMGVRTSESSSCNPISPYVFRSMEERTYTVSLKRLSLYNIQGKIGSSQARSLT